MTVKDLDRTAQYIIKNLLIISAALVVGGTVRGNREDSWKQ